MPISCTHPTRGATGNCGVCGYPIPPNEKDALRERFRNVIKLAGYSDAAAEKILEEWFEYYAGDRAQFIGMMEEYEEKCDRTRPDPDLRGI